MNHTQLEQSYETQVYAGVLGKVIGVYLGRPFEGWSKERIEEKWGLIDHYVHEDQGVPLVVSDDDISGTLTFVRALEDSGLYADTPEDFFGKTWLNYLIENKTILWWGGMGHSTEHTAYLRLKAGIPSPKSGSMELNGKTVAEQIEADHHQSHHDCRENNQVGINAQILLVIGHHDTERMYALQAQIQICQSCF